MSRVGTYILLRNNNYMTARFQTFLTFRPVPAVILRRARRARKLLVSPPRLWRSGSGWAALRPRLAAPILPAGY